MKRFEFKLQKTLAWRETCADREKVELERLQQIRSGIANSRESVQNDREELSKTAESEKPLTGADLQQMGLFTRSLANLEQRLVAEQASYSNQIESQQQKCIAADRNHQLLIHLRDSQLNNWRHQFEQEMEQLGTDSWNARRIRSASTPSEEK